MWALRPLGALGCLLLIGSLQGCAASAARWNAYFQCKAEQQASRSQIRQVELDALRAELESEREAMKAEREMELAALREELQERKDCMRNQMDESVRTKLGVNLDQRVRVGQLQVDMASMKKVIEEKERDHQYRLEIYDKLRKAQERQERAVLAATANGRLAVGAADDFSMPQGNCAVANSCAVPPTDCSQPGRLPAQAPPPRKPVQQPLLPTEIPLMLPVTLELGMERATMEGSAVRRLPVRKPPCAQKPCGCCPACEVGAPCNSPVSCAPPAAVGPSSSVAPGSREETPAPGVPESEDSGLQLLK